MGRRGCSRRLMHAVTLGLLGFAGGCGAASDSPAATDVSVDVASSGDGADVVTTDAPNADVAAAYVVKPLSALLKGKQKLNIAHRGGRRLRPGHTLEAYKHAVSVGAHLLEMDLHRTADGVLVSIHDATVDRTTDGKGLVKELTWAQLQQLDAGHTWTNDGGKTFPFRGKGLRIARADEVLKQFPKMHFSVEIKQVKPPIVDDVMTLFEQMDAVHRTVFASFADMTIAALRKRTPSAATAMAMGEMVTFSALEKDEWPTYTRPCDFVQVPSDVVTADFMARAAAHGVFVHPWTVNDAKEMKKLIGLGVDGIFTDDPDLLSGLLEQR